MNTIAVVIGATGLTGFELTKLLLKDDIFSKVIILTRRGIGLENKKLVEHIIDFNDPQSYADLVRGNVLFSCMGTTIKKAKKKSEQYKVDVTYQYDVAMAASKNKVNKYILISAPGAKKKSMFFYSRIKGILEEKVKRLNFDNIIIFRPSVLIGNREETRKNEEFAASFIRGIVRLLPFMRKYRGIEGKELAQTMINSFKLQNPKEIYELGEIF